MKTRPAHHPHPVPAQEAERPASSEARCAQKEQAVARAFIEACEAELAAPKPGNVHHFAPGHRMEAADFIKSAHAAAQHIAQHGASVGQRILGATEATWAAVHQNTNLGIVLLCAPLAEAALTARSDDLVEETARVLAALDRNDAALAFRAISMARPAGLGDAPEHDVTAPAQTTLLEAMRAAADRDSIARQYANGFADIFGLGAQALRAARAEDRSPADATLRVYLAFLSALPDSHVARKWGLEAAEKLQAEAQAFCKSIEAASSERETFALALDFDGDLKRRGINPGTSADLTVAVLFADKLTDILASARKND